MSSEYKKFLKLTKCICTNLRRSSRNISQIYNRNLRKSGELINANQVSILVALSQFKKLKITELSKKLNMERTTITRNLSVLKKFNWIQILIEIDGRIKFVSITKEGKRVIQKIIPFWENAQNETKKLLGKDLKLFQENLKKLI